MIETDNMEFALTAMAGFASISAARRGDRRLYGQSVLGLGLKFINRRKTLVEDVRRGLPPSDVPEIQALRDSVLQSKAAALDLYDAWHPLLSAHGQACTQHIVNGAEWPTPLSPVLLMEGAARLFAAELLVVEREADLAYIEDVARRADKASEAPAWVPRLLKGGLDDAGPR